MLDTVFQLSQHFLKTKNRKYIRYLLKKHSLESRFSIVVGQRGVGKSTALVQYLLRQSGGDIFSKKILYVPSDHFSLGQYTLYEIAEEFVKYGGEIICIDEVHTYKEWSKELKSIYDTFPNLKIIASGSSILEVRKGTHDLSRRAVVYEMKGMSFREFIEISCDISLPAYSVDDIFSHHRQIALEIIGKISKTKRTLFELFSDYLVYGYYPYFIEFPDVSLFQITLEQQIHTSIDSDIIAVYPHITGGSIRKLKKLLSALSVSVPFTPDLNKLMKIVDVADQRTLKSYLKYLELAGIIMQFGKSGRIFDSLEKPEKIYLNNSNQIFALSGEKDNRGAVRESFFACMLSLSNTLSIPKKGDFLIDNQIVVEIGGKNKTRKQIASIENSYLVLDNIEVGGEKKIPLWLFGFIY